MIFLLLYKYFYLSILFYYNINIILIIIINYINLKKMEDLLPLLFDVSKNTDI